MADEKSKINDKDRVISLLMFYLEKSNSEAQKISTILITVLSIGLLLLTFALLVIAFFRNYGVILVIVIGIIIIWFLGALLIKSKEYNYRMEKNKNELRYQLNKYEIDEESKTLIDIAFDETN